MTKTDINLRAAEARAQLEQIESEVERLRTAAEQRRADAERRFDRALVERHDVAAEDAEVEAAEQRLREAVLADPVYRARIEVAAARYVRYLRHHTVVGAAARLGHDVQYGTWPGGPAVAPPAPSAVEDAEIEAWIEAEGRRIGADRVDALEQQRLDAGEQAAGKQ